MRKLLVPALLLLSACSSNESASTGGGTTGGSTASTGGGSVVIGGARPVKMVIPDSYDGKTPVPLVVLLHGYGASGLVQDLYFGMTAQAQARGFIYAIPDGTPDAGGKKFWNASDACCDFGGTGVDDSAYLAGVVEEIQQAYAIDPKRIHFMGHSNGGFMSYRMACDHSDKVASIVSLAGAMPSDASLCKPTEPVAVLQIHGTLDTVILYEGGSTVAPYPGARASVLDWVALDGCSADGDTSSPSLNLDQAIPGAETTVERFDKCKPGGAAELWSIQAGTHVPSLSGDFAPSAIDFLLAHPKP